MNRRILSVTLIFLVSICLTTFSASIKWGGKVYFDYNYKLSPDDVKGENAFSLKRAYLTVKGELTKKDKEGLKVKFKVTTDLKELSDLGKSGTYEATDGKVEIGSSKFNGFYMRFLKYAYLELDNLFVKNLKFRIGQNSLPWVGYEEHISGMRWWGSVFPDREKKLSSTDRGISLIYKCPAGYFDTHISYVNGEGYHHPEKNEYKDIMGRLTLTPFAKNENLKGLQLHFYYGTGKVDSEKIRNRLIGAISFKSKYFVLMGEYLGTEDGLDSDPIKGEGFAGFIRINMGEISQKGNWGFFIRYDNFDPNTDLKEDAHSRFIVGPYFYVTKKAAFGIEYSNTSYEQSGKDSESAIYLHTLFKF